MRSQEEIQGLISRSQILRKELFQMMWGNGKRGLIPSSFSAAEIYISLFYGGVMNYNSSNPKWPDRDSLIVSKGHATGGIYPILADRGFFSRDELKKYSSEGGILTPYAMHNLPGIEAITGSLGHGFGIAGGIALANRLDGKTNTSYVILGDGECHEGSVWEMAGFASHNKLNNLVAIVDRNKLCTVGAVDDLLKIEPLNERWKSFGWDVQRVDGHSYKQLLGAFDEINIKKREAHLGGERKPFVIIADTIKGKGISYMENDSTWHNKAPNQEQITRAFQDLEVNCITE